MAIVLAYHGCDKETAQKLLSGSPFVASDKPYDWLGKGSYFWEEDVLRAYQWAVERRPNAPCVVGVALDLGICLDLTKQSGITALKRAYESYTRLQLRSNKPIPQNVDAKHSRPGDLVLRYLDRAVVDHLHDLYAEASLADAGRTREFDTVRALFPEGRPLYERSGFQEKTHVQIAVRPGKENQVLGVFRVPDFQLKELNIPQTIYDC